jgi:hypothetical protein
MTDMVSKELYNADQAHLAETLGRFERTLKSVDDNGRTTSEHVAAMRREMEIKRNDWAIDSDPRLDRPPRNGVASWLKDNWIILAILSALCGGGGSAAIANSGPDTEEMQQIAVEAATKALAKVIEGKGIGKVE